MSKISEGGMGAVFLAEHLLIGRRVALKLLLKHLSTDDTSTRRFLNEARAVNAIRHPHIVDITDVGTTPTGEYFLAMELLEGETLSDRLKQGPMPVEEAVGIAAQVAGALTAAHQKNIIHRDLKPGNIFLTQQGDETTFVKVLDFGIAKLAGQEMSAGLVTKTGEVFGTPYYMSPEQCEGSSALDERTDIYSLGVVLFEMLSGRLPFVGDGFGQIVMKHMQQAPPTLRSMGVTVPGDLEAVVMRALAKNPADRIPSMAEFRAQLIRGWAGSNTEAARRLTLLAPIAGARTTVVRKGLAWWLRRALALPRRLLSREVDTETATMSIGERWPTQKRIRGRRLVFAAGGLLVMIGIGAAALWFRAPRPVDATGPAPSMPVVQPTPPLPAPAVVRPAPRPAPPEDVRLILRSDPPGAEVRRRGSEEVVGITPTEWRVHRSEDEMPLVFSKPGFVDAEQGVVPSVDRDVLVKLAAVKRRPTKPKVTPLRNKSLEDPWAE